MSALDQQVAEALDSLAHFDGLMAQFGHLYGLGWFSKDEYIKRKARQQELRDALLTTHRRQVLTEIEEKLRTKANASDGRAVRLTAHMGYMWSADFVASLRDTKENDR